MRRVSIRPSIRIFLLAVTVVALLAPAGVATATSPISGHFFGHAYGTAANATSGPIATQLGRSAYVPCPCRPAGTNFETISNSVDNVRARNVFRADGVFTTMRAGKDPVRHTAIVRATATVDAVRALDGLITADAVRAVAKTRAGQDTLGSTWRGSRFVNLRIFGQPIADDVAPNTRVALRGFGYARLKEVERGQVGTNRHAIAVTMIHIFITRDNRLDLPVGSEIIIARAYAGYDRDEPPSMIDGAAWAASATSSAPEAENRVGKAAALYMGCLGTGGEVISNNVDIIRARGILASRTGKTTLAGDVESDGSWARGTATVKGLNLLDGAVTADVVKAVAVARWDELGETGSTSTQGSQFVNLRVLGTPFGDEVAPNTRVELPGVGYVVLNEQAQRSNSDGALTRVIMVHLYVTEDTASGLPAGTEIMLSRVRVSTRDF